MSSIAQSAALLLFLSAFLAACSPKGQADFDSAHTANDTQTKDQVIARVEADLNGDGVIDQAKLLLYSSMGEEPAQGYELVSAWPYYSDGAPPTTPAEGGPVVLVIEHGMNEAKGETDDFLLFDPNEVSVLATDAAENLAATAVKELPEKGAALAELPQQFTGDVLVLPTEAGIDTFVYWTGKTYRVFEPLEMP